MNEDEILYNKIYERTKGFGRTHFIKEIMRLQREIEELKSGKKTSKKTAKTKHGEYQNVKLTANELQLLIECYGEEQTNELIKYLDEYIEMTGYKRKSHYLCIKKWVVDAIKEKKYKYNRQPIRKEVIPDWMNKEIKSEEPSPEEIEELQEMLKNL